MSRIRLPALIVFLLVSCTARADIVVRDDTGRDVKLDHAAQRIISLAPHVTELLYEIGAGPHVVAATAYSDFPDDAQRLPRVGGLAGLDIERIVALKPDLVIGWSSGTSAAEFEKLERIGVAVFRSEPHTLADVASTLERFGTLTGTSATAGEVAGRFTARVAALREANARRAPIRVFYQVWNSPLMTVGGRQLITQVIELCGGRNIFAALPMLAPIVDPEAVIAADPQLIVTAATGDDHRADIAAWQRWGDIAAVRDRRYLFLDPALITRHTSRLLIGAERLCRAIDEARPH